MATDPPAGKGSILGPAIVSFALNRTFPDEATSSIPIHPNDLPAGIAVLDSAKENLEEEIRTVNRETAADLNKWFNDAKILQDDINRSKQIANDIVHQSEEPEVSGKKIEEAEAQAAFLVRELNYNDRLLQTLRGLKSVGTVLDEVDTARGERRILDALRLLEKSHSQLDRLEDIGSSKVLKLMKLRAEELSSHVHDVFNHVWNALVHVDEDKSELSVHQTRPDEPMNLADAVTGLKEYEEVGQRMSQLWHSLDRAIIGPRMDLRRSTLPGIRIQDQCLRTEGQADRSVKSMFADLREVFSFLVQVLPSDLVQPISKVMIPDVTSRVIQVWLDSAVPSSLAEMDEFEAIITSTKSFCEFLRSLNYTGFGELQEWGESAPKVWLSKCRESALDSVRVKLSQGLGAHKEVERVETQTVTRSEGKELVTNGPSAAAAAADDHGWDSAWSDDEQTPAESEENHANAEPAAEDDGADAWGAWGVEDDTPAVDDAPTSEGITQPPGAAEAAEAGPGGDEEGDGADAWGWGDEDATEDAEPTLQHEPPLVSKTQPHTKGGSSTREMTLKEVYHISSMPDSVLSLIFAILEDGASLTQESHESTPVAAAAAGLFSVPTLVLAMFRAISPYYYSSEAGGNMFLYNDATYLAEKLRDHALKWKTRDDLTTRAQAMLRIDNDIKALQGFANRAYSNEMNTQKTIVRDLLGGEQSVMAESFIEAAVAQVRSAASIWDGILAKSAWYQAAGSLVDAVATKVIADVMEMPSIGQDEAFHIANMIAKITELDDLFPPVRGHSVTDDSTQIPTTAQYVPSWLRLKYLSEVLQSTSREVRFLWVESELSLYFTLQEVLDLIDVSFEDNARTREIVKEIKQNPRPIQD